MFIKIFSKCGMTLFLFPLLLALFCIAGCLESPAERPSASFSANDNSIMEEQDSISYSERDGPSLQLNFDAELGSDLLSVRGSLVQSRPVPLAYVMLNATLRSGNDVKFYTKYLLMDVEPGRECGFEICKNAIIAPGEYNCTLEAVGPDGSLACESRRCSLKEDAASSKGDGAAAGGWSELRERAFWAEIESGALEAKAAMEESGAGEAAGEEESGSDEESDLQAAGSGGASSEGRFVASISGKKYHRTDCRYASNIKPENRIYFQSAAQAEEKGYLPCKSCNP